jgi:large subunit ribosomal protein L23
MSARDIIVRPIVTEKTNRLSEEDNKYTFEVAKDSNKSAVAQAIREIYGINPVKVNIVNQHPKKRRVGRYEGMTRAIKKAVVKLPEGQKIDLFGNGEEDK